MNYTLLDFKKLKSKLEDDGLCYNVLIARKSIHQNKEIMYLDCHRIGNFQSRSTGVKN